MSEKDLMPDLSWGAWGRYANHPLTRMSIAAAKGDKNAQLALQRYRYLNGEIYRDGKPIPQMRAERPPAKRQTVINNGWERRPPSDWAYNLGAPRQYQEMIDAGIQAETAKHPVAGRVLGALTKAPETIVYGTAAGALRPVLSGSFARKAVSHIAGKGAGIAAQAAYLGAPFTKELVNAYLNYGTPTGKETWAYYPAETIDRIASLIPTYGNLVTPIVKSSVEPEHIGGAMGRLTNWAANRSPDTFGWTMRQLGNAANNYLINAENGTLIGDAARATKSGTPIRLASGFAKNVNARQLWRALANYADNNPMPSWYEDLSPFVNEVRDRFNKDGGHGTPEKLQEAAGNLSRSFRALDDRGLGEDAIGYTMDAQRRVRNFILGHDNAGRRDQLKKYLIGHPDMAVDAVNAGLDNFNKVIGKASDEDIVNAYLALRATDRALSK